MRQDKNRYLKGKNPDQLVKLFYDQLKKYFLNIFWLHKTEHAQMRVTLIK